MNKIELFKYLNFLENRFLQNKNVDLANSTKYESWINVINDLKNKFEWQFKSQEEKRDSRWAWVRSLEKRGKDVSEMKRIIELYDSIILTKPYLKPYLNIKGIQTLIEVCDKYLRLIDYSGRNVEVIIDEGELKTTFDPLLNEDHNIDHLDLEKIKNIYNQLSNIFSPS